MSCEAIQVIATRPETKSFLNVSISGAPQYQLGKNEVHIFPVSLSDRDNDLSNLLSPDEMERARRFRFPTDREHFITGRGTLRLILGRYLQLDPASIQFEYSPNGKPFISPRQNRPNLCFNLSHSGELAVYAVALDRSIGIDVEKISAIQDEDDIALRFFSGHEIDRLCREKGNERTKLFFEIWTRKEAFLKCSGLGFGQENPDAANNLKPEIQTFSISLFDGYAAALALCGEEEFISKVYSEAGENKPVK